MEYRHVAGEWRREHNVIFNCSNRSLPDVKGNLADDKAITCALLCIAISAIRKCCCIAFAWICSAKCDAIPLIRNTGPHNLATGFRPPSATVVSAEPFSHGTGTLRCLHKEMATYRHWSVSLWRDPDDVSHCRILSPDKTEWRLISATLCGWRRCYVADQLWFTKRIREEEFRGQRSGVVSGEISMKKLLVLRWTPCRRTPIASATQ